MVESVPQSTSGSLPNATASIGPPGSRSGALFDRTDWLSCGVTTTLMLAAYLWTLAPDVTLGFSGIFATGAHYAGVPHPPGYPLWTLYAYAFTHLVPISNVAWRAAAASALAGATACGIVALMVSRGGAMLLEGFPAASRLSLREQRMLRGVCGYTSGAIFGFSGAFWGRTVIADVWSLSILLFAAVLCLLMRWFYEPDRRQYLYRAFFVYGLTLTNSQMLFAVAPALPLIAALGDAKVGRDLLFGCTLLLLGGLIGGSLDWLPSFADVANPASPLFQLYLIVGCCIVTPAILLIAKTRSLLTKWKVLLASGSVFVLGLVPYLYLPIASMTNPPINWSYPRTVSGFYHALSRGQYERIHPADTILRYGNQLKMYVEITSREFDWFYLPLALLPFLSIQKLRVSERKWMLGLLVVFVSLTLLLIAVLNPSDDVQSRALNKVFWSASYVVLAIWVGYGLVLVGLYWAVRRIQQGPTSR